MCLYYIEIHMGTSHSQRPQTAKSKSVPSRFYSAINLQNTKTGSTFPSRKTFASIHETPEKKNLDKESYLAKNIEGKPNNSLTYMPQ